MIMLGLLTVASCKNEIKDKIGYKTPEFYFADAIEIKGEPLDAEYVASNVFKCFYTPYGFLGSMRSEDDKLAHLADLKTGEIKVSACSFGRGPEEILISSPDLALYGNSLYMLDQRADWIKKVEIHGDTLKTFDLQKLSLGTYFAQAAEMISQEDLPNPELLSLVLNCLFALSKLDVSQMQVKSVFELRSACLAGYSPDLYGCYRCGCDYPDRFDISEGMLECHTCRNTGGGIRMPVTPGVLEAMRYIMIAESEDSLDTWSHLIPGWKSCREVLLEARYEYRNDTEKHRLQMQENFLLFTESFQFIPHLFWKSRFIPLALLFQDLYMLRKRMGSFIVPLRMQILNLQMRSVKCALQNSWISEFTFFDNCINLTEFCEQKSESAGKILL